MDAFIQVPCETVVVAGLRANFVVGNSASLLPPTPRLSTLPPVATPSAWVNLGSPMKLDSE
jgi:hypothetical protein